MTKHLPTSTKSTNGRIVVLQRVLRLLSRWAPSVAAPLAERLFLTPIPFRQPARELEWARTSEPLTIASPNGGQMSAWAWGKGSRTALLVHGWSGRGLQLGALAEPLVAKGYRVIAFDGPAHGSSSGKRTNLPEYADAISDAARSVGGVEIVIAHSFGTVATLLALARGRLSASRFVLIAAPSRFSMILQRFSEMTGFTTDVVDRMRKRLARRFRFSWDALEPMRLASGARVPALVIHDRDDDSIPVEEGMELAKAWPGARFLATEGLGHHRVLRDEEVVEAVVRFAETTEPVEEHSSAFDAGAVEVFVGGPAPHRERRGVTARVHGWLTRPLIVPFDPLELRLDEKEIAGELAFGRD